MSHLNSNTVESLGLGAPIGTTQTPHSASTRGMDDDEHGAGVGSGVAGGGTRAGNNADVYQASRGDGFSAGLSGEHTSGGLPSHGELSMYPHADAQARPPLPTSSPVTRPLLLDTTAHPVPTLALAPTTA